jgi:hypothetical protein
VATKLKPDQELKREVGNSAGEFIVILTNEGVYMKEKGRRKKFGPVSYGYLFVKCAEVQALTAEAHPPYRVPARFRSLLRGR